LVYEPGPLLWRHLRNGTPARLRRHEVLFPKYLFKISDDESQNIVCIRKCRPKGNLDNIIIETGEIGLFGVEVRNLCRNGYSMLQ